MSQWHKQLKRPPQKHVKQEVSFAEFFLVWADLQGWQVPELHLKIIQFLTSYKTWEASTGVLQIFRGAGKSTIVGLFIVWMLTQDPTLRFLVLSADKKTATKITRDVSGIIDRHPLAKHLKGEENIWQSDAIYVTGFNDSRTPSVTSWGITSNITGGRADWIIYDDVEVPKNTLSDTAREELRIKLVEPVHILVPGGYELFIGTPHTYDSIYPEVVGESDKEEVIRVGSTSLKIPIFTEYEGAFPNITGVSSWPERFPLDEVLKRQASSKTKGHFLSQYLLLPYNPNDTLLDPTLIAHYNHEIDVHVANGSLLLRIGPYRMMGVTAFWDPSLAKLSTDDSVFSIIFSSDDGHYFIHRTLKLSGEAEEQCEQVLGYCKQFEVPHLIIETNGVGAFLPAIFRKVAEKSDITCEGRATTKNKAQKILEAYEVRLSAGYIHAHKSVMDSPFMSQLRDFSPRTIGRGKDDFIDSAASAILNEPIRIQTAFAARNAVNWLPDSEGVEIELEGFSF